MQTMFKSLCLLFFVAVPACSSSSPPPPDPTVPEMPLYANDVQPIFMANCTRCHGEGGMLNAAPNPDGTPNTVGAPSTCYLTMLDDTGDCTPGDGGIIPASCKRGSRYCATPAGMPPDSLLDVYVIVLTPDEGGMPPPPAAPLSAHDKEVIRRWLQNPN